METGEIVRANLEELVSPSARDIALSESIGGNAGMACYALNLEVDGEGRIDYIGNAPERTNAAVRVFVPVFAARGTKMHEIAVEVSGEIEEEARSVLSKSLWIWNLYREQAERDLLLRFLHREIGWNTLVEFLSAKYPELARELG